MMITREQIFMYHVHGISMDKRMKVSMMGTEIVM